MAGRGPGRRPATRRPRPPRRRGGHRRRRHRQSGAGRARAGLTTSCRPPGAGARRSPRLPPTTATRRAGRRAARASARREGPFADLGERPRRVEADHTARAPHLGEGRRRVPRPAAKVVGEVDLLRTMPLEPLARRGLEHPRHDPEPLGCDRGVQKEQGTFERAPPSSRLHPSAYASGSSGRSAPGRCPIPGSTSRHSFGEARSRGMVPPRSCQADGAPGPPSRH